MGTAVVTPFNIFQDQDGNPLEGGKIYIGTSGLNPETNPIGTYWDSALTIPAAQPIRTTGGYPSYLGNVANVWVNGDYSITVRDKKDQLVFSSLTGSGLTPTGLLNMIKTVDGPGSGLDADTLDGYHYADIQDPITNTITQVGWVYDSTDKYQFMRSIVALSRPVGAYLTSAIPLTPVTVSGSKSTASPGNPEYLPIIGLDQDQDIANTKAPDAVTTLRAYQTTIAGVSSYSGTVAGSVVTFSATTANNAFVAAIANDSLAQRWFTSGQSATYAASGGDFANPRCINVAGTDYAIASVNTATPSITVVGTPTAGTQTVIFYPYRIAGNANAIRLFKTNGFVMAQQGDADGLYAGPLRTMDQAQGHRHSPLSPTVQFIGTSGGITGAAGSTFGAVSTTGDPTTDGTNGTPRTGKNTNARSMATFFYLWVRRLLT